MTKQAFSLVFRINRIGIPISLTLLHAINPEIKTQNHTTKAKEPTPRAKVLQPELQYPALAFASIGIIEN
jgi:hypothetical protein